MSWKLRALLAASCVAALALSVGGLVIARENTLVLLREGASYERYRATTTDSEPMSPDRWRFVGRNYLSDITETLPRLRVPILLMLGERDLHVDVAETARVHRDQAPAGLLTIRTFPDVSHNIVKFALDRPGSTRAYLTAVFAPDPSMPPAISTRCASTPAMPRT
ncbi:alpha/beta fold hydrolase, partial [Nocardia sp. NPDC059764]|uniref:alpha/beta fold hydrolase n=1 Tax=Nocardia sp. NPDC059764 TaxID=3346939 RepID=UPI00364B36A0